jgi:hypothetical protein
VAQLNPGAPQPQPQPDIEQILQSAPKGKLTVRAVLVSGGSTTPVPGAHAEVHLFHDNRPFRQLKVLLDEHGAAVLEDLPIVMGVVPLVRVEYKGLTYQEAGPQMDASNRESSIDVKVYDTTEQMPAWRIPMRHVIATPSPSGVAVTELVVIDNPSDKTWLGKEPDEKGNRPTVELTLPENTKEVTLESGFHGWCCTSFEGRTLHIKMPMMPGQASFRFSYKVAATQGSSLLSMVSPAPVDHMMFMLPDDATKISPAPDAADLKSSTSSEGGVRARIYQCDALTPGQPAGLLVSGLPVILNQSVAHTPVNAWIFIGVGSVLAAGAALLLWRSKKSASQLTQPRARGLREDRA